MMVQRRPDLHLYQGPTLACNVNVGPTMSVLSGQHWANVCMLTGLSEIHCDIHNKDLRTCKLHNNEHVKSINIYKIYTRSKYKIGSSTVGMESADDFTILRC